MRFLSFLGAILSLHVLHSAKVWIFWNGSTNFMPQGLILTAQNCCTHHAQPELETTFPGERPQCEVEPGPACRTTGERVSTRRGDQKRLCLHLNLPFHSQRDTNWLLYLQHGYKTPQCQGLKLYCILWAVRILYNWAGINKKQWQKQSPPAATEMCH